MKSSTAWNLTFLSWVMALMATLGSLFFSEVMKYPPCVLCWYQRICMYPMVLIILAGLFPLTKSLFRFSLPLLSLGWIIAFYHNLLYYKILPESAAPCVQGISCTSKHIEWLGFYHHPFFVISCFFFYSYSSPYCC